MCGLYNVRKLYFLWSMPMHDSAISVKNAHEGNTKGTVSIPPPPGASPPPPPPPTGASKLPSPPRPLVGRWDRCDETINSV
jgi:hypothetical protein